MRVAFLTDVHGNLPALEAVLADAREQGAEAIWDGGDAIGYHPWPSECVEQLAAACAITIMGNYDRKVLKAPQRQKRWLRTKDPLKARTLVWAWDHLTPVARELLATRVSRVRSQIDGRSILTCHGSPDSRKEPLGPATPARRWAELSTAADADLVLHGHTHVAYTRREQGTLFVNPGAVGRSEDGDPRSSYALIDADGDRLTVRVRRVAYDTERVVAAIAAHDLPGEFAVMVTRGISLPRARRLRDHDRS